MFRKAHASRSMDFNTSATIRSRLAENGFKPSPNLSHLMPVSQTASSVGLNLPATHTRERSRPYVRNEGPEVAKIDNDRR